MHLLNSTRENWHITYNTTAVCRYTEPDHRTMQKKTQKPYNTFEAARNTGRNNKKLKTAPKTLAHIL